MIVPEHRLTLRDRGLTLEFFREEYSDEGLDLALKNNVKRLVIGHLVSDQEDPYAFLHHWNFLEALRIVDRDKRSVSTVQVVSCLDELSLDDNSGCELAASAFPNLRTLTFNWSERRYKLLTHEQISRLCVMHMKPKAKTWVPILPSLETLSLFSGSIRTMEPFAECKKLKSLRLSDCRQFEDNSSLAAFQSLEVVHIQGCPKAVDFDVFNELPSLKRLILSEVKNPPPRSFFREDIDVR